MKIDLKDRLAHIETLTPKQLLDLCTDLSIYFVADREFKAGWVIEGYWKVYEQSDSKGQAALTGTSGW